MGWLELGIGKFSKKWKKTNGGTKSVCKGQRQKLMNQNMLEKARSKTKLQRDVEIYSSLKAKLKEELLSEFEGMVGRTVERFHNQKM